MGVEYRLASLNVTTTTPDNSFNPQYLRLAPPGTFAATAASPLGTFPPANLANFNTGNAATTLVVPDVPAGTYFIRIRAVNTCGIGPPSGEVQLIVSAGNSSACTSAPRGLTFSTSGSTVTLTWTAPASGTAASYVVQAGNQPGGADLANFDTGSNATTLVTSNVPAGPYYTRVYGKNGCGLSPASNEVLMTVP
jgi:hypothetical protein